MGLGQTTKYFLPFLLSGSRVQKISKFRNLSRWQIHLEGFSERFQKSFKISKNLQDSLFLTFSRFGTPKSSFSIGFIRVSDMAKCHVGFIYKRNAFFDHLEPFLRFLLKKSSFSTGFIRVFATLFCLLKNLVFDWFYKAFRHGGMSCRIHL